MEDVKSATRKTSHKTLWLVIAIVGCVAGIAAGLAVLWSRWRDAMSGLDFSDWDGDFTDKTIEDVEIVDVPKDEK